MAGTRKSFLWMLASPDAPASFMLVIAEGETAEAAFETIKCKVFGGSVGLNSTDRRTEGFALRMVSARSSFG